MKLVVISHTEHYTTNDGTLVGWGPTVTELNRLLSVFDEIVHVAMLHPGNPPPSSLPYTSSKITLIALPPLGGKSVLSKLKLIANIPKVILIVAKALKDATVFQLRTPTGIGVFLIPYLTWFVSTKGWYKYAGNWNQNHPPLGYRLQRWMLKKQTRPVTINGSWENQPEHCITFENPCLTVDDYNRGKALVLKKNYQAPWSFCFVGRLEKAKGVARIIEAFTMLPEAAKKHISQVDFVGNGEELEYFKELALKSGVTMNFHGFLARDKVFALYKKSHYFLLPSDSEGFPKVIAEAMNFGCIPIVSDVSSIGQYVDKSNGYLLNPINATRLMQILDEILNTEDEIAIEQSHIGRKVSKKFIFDTYNNRIKKEILKSIEK